MSTAVEIFNETKSFWDRYIDCWGEPWDDEYKLPFIVKSPAHGKWISFKNFSVSARSAILNELVNSPNIEITKRSVRKTLSIYRNIVEFITERRSEVPEDEVASWTPEGIALELRMVLTESIITISEIMGEEPCLYSAQPDRKKGGVQKEYFQTDKAKKLLEDLEEEGLVEKNGDKYTWNGTAKLYGYFVDVSSVYLSLRTSNGRKPWSKYENLITNHKKLKDSARSGVNDYDNGRQVKPEGYEIIEKLCDS